MLGQTCLDARRALDPTALECGRQLAAAIKDQQIPRLQEVTDMVVSVTASCCEPRIALIQCKQVRAMFNQKLAISILPFMQAIGSDA